MGIDKNGRQYVVSVGGIPVQSPVIADEQAVIIWDEVHKIEHFIRQADINTTDPNVGFLVPTPQAPELAEIDPGIFDLVREDAAPKMVPEVVYQTPLEMMGYALKKVFSPDARVFTTISETLAYAGSGPSGVEVISEQNVADYHAVVLEADNVGMLSQWLKDNGYAWSKKAETWLKPYVDAKWKITAFKLIKPSSEQNSTSLVSHAIRMSFPTDRPFFPYSEPGDTEKGQSTSVGSRSLSVAILGSQRMSGVLADGHAWPGVLQFSGAMESPYDAGQIMAFAKLDGTKYQMTMPTRLTYFLDNSSPRPGTADLNFSPDADQSLMRKIEVDHSLPVELRLDFSHPLSDFCAALIVLLVAGPFIYYLSWAFRKPPGQQTVPRNY
jgi:hypothetical protein